MNPITVLFLNICIHSGSADCGLAALPRIPNPRTRPIVALPKLGVIAGRIEGEARIAFIPSRTSTRCAVENSPLLSLSSASRSTQPAPDLREPRHGRLRPCNPLGQCRLDSADRDP